MDLASAWNAFSSACAVVIVLSLSLYLLPIVVLTLSPPQNLRQKYCTASANWAVVTGASSGIGKALAFRLASQGINICLIALDDTHLHDTHRQLTAAFPTLAFRAIAVDLAAPCEQYMPRIVEATDDIRVALLFNNAGYLLMGYFDQLPVHQHIANVQCNALAAVTLTHHFYSRMVRHNIRGCIAFTSSAVMFLPSPFALMYGASKALLTQFAVSLALESQMHGIDCTVFHPSYTRSNLYAKTPELAVLRLLARMAWTAEDVADVVMRSVGRVIVRDFGVYAVVTNVVGRVFDAGFLARSSVGVMGYVGPVGVGGGGREGEKRE